MTLCIGQRLRAHQKAGPRSDTTNKESSHSPFAYLTVPGEIYFAAPKKSWNVSWIAMTGSTPDEHVWVSALAGLSPRVCFPGCQGRAAGGGSIASQVLKVSAGELSFTASRCVDHKDCAVIEHLDYKHVLTTARCAEFLGVARYQVCV